MNSWILSVIRRRRIPTIILLLGVFLFLGTISSAFAQGGLLANPSFESGNLLPGWAKWGYPISNVQVLSCCFHSGTYSAWVEPKGKYVELQQNVSVQPFRTYELKAYAYTYGAFNAQVGWWENATGPTVCATTTSTSYALLYCELNINGSTSAFNVHLGGNAPAGNGSLTDDWSLTLKPSTGLIYQAFALHRTNLGDQKQGMRANVWTDQQPPQSGGNFEASPVAVCTRIPCDSNAGYVETGFVKGTYQDVNNVLQEYASWQNDGGTGYGENLHLGVLLNNTWYNMGIQYMSFLNRWVALRDGNIVFAIPPPTSPPLNFQSGAEGACGLEATVNVTLGVQCDTLQYLPSGGLWTSFDYNNVQIDGPYCVSRPYQYAAIGSGPCY